MAAQKAAGTYAAYLHSEIIRVITPYLVLGLVALALAALIARTHFPSIDVEEGHENEGQGDSLGVLFHRHFVFGVIAQFLYVGAQVGTWSYVITYVQTYTGSAERSAGFWLTGALIAFTVGRFVSTALLRYLPAQNLLAAFAVINAAVAGFAAFRPGWLGVGCLVVISFFMSMMFPTIFALGIKGLGTRTKTGGSLLVMSIIGGAVLTPLMGKVADLAGVAQAYLVPAACFIGIALYAWFGSQPSPRDLTVS